MFGFLISIGNRGGYPRPILGFGFPDGLDLFAGLLGIPFVEDVVEGHHLKTRLFGGVHILLNGDEGNTHRWIYKLQKPAHLHLFSTKPGQILDDDGADLAPLYHLLHPMEARSVKGGAGDTVIHKKFRVQIPVIPGILSQDGFLILDGIGLVLLTVSASLLGIFYGKPTVEGSDFLFVLDLFLCHNNSFLRKSRALRWVEPIVQCPASTIQFCGSCVFSNNSFNCCNNVRSLSSSNRPDTS